MTADLMLPRVAPAPVSAPSPARHPDPAFAAIPRLTRLRDALAASRPVGRPSRWHEPPVFFFNPDRQAELAAALAPRAAARANDPLAELIAAELPALLASAEVRRAARAIPGLHEAAARLPAAKPLADLLAVPDDEAVLVLHPRLRVGFRVLVRGVADIAQFHLLMPDAAGDLLPGPPPPSRFTAAGRAADPVIPAGVPMVAEARFQMFTPAAVQADGSVPGGFRGCQHWLWPTYPLAVVPRVDGERVILLGEPAFRQTWEVERRFPAMPAETRLLDVLSPFRVAERLTRLAGRPVPVRAEDDADVPVLARAA